MSNVCTMISLNYIPIDAVARSVMLIGSGSLNLFRHGCSGFITAIPAILLLLRSPDN